MVSFDSGIGKGSWTKPGFYFTLWLAHCRLEMKWLAFKAKCNVFLTHCLVFFWVFFVPFIIVGDWACYHLDISPADTCIVGWPMATSVFSLHWLLLICLLSVAGSRSVFSVFFLLLFNIVPSGLFFNLLFGILCIETISGSCNTLYISHVCSM